MKYYEKLSGTRFLWITFTATLICTIAFKFVAARFDLVLIDKIIDPDQTRAAISTMSDSQRTVHTWVTGTLDVLYPLVYGAFFIGTAYRFIPKIGTWLAAPIFILVPVDLAEGMVQILGLTGVVDWLNAKFFLTSLKNVLFGYGLLLTASGWAAWISSKVR